MGRVGQTEQTFYRDTELSRKRKSFHNGSPLNMFQKAEERHSGEGTRPKSKHEDVPRESNSSSLIYQALLIPDEECLAEAEHSFFDIVGFREGFHLFGGEIYITNVPAKIYLTTYRVSPLDPTAVVYM